MLPAPDQAPPVILIIDDDDINVELLSASLYTEGFRVITADSGAAGRVLAAREQPQLILLDVVMAGEDGFTTCTKLKADTRTSHIPVIFLTASTSAEDRVRGLTIGGVDFISKPHVYQELLARIRIHLRLARYDHLLVNMQVARLDDLRAMHSAMLVRPEEIPDAAFAVWYQPLHAIGGDFYDVVPISDGVYGYLLADISGHDIDVAFFTSALKALFHQNCTSFHSPLELMHVLNDVLLAILQPEQFITACYVALNRHTRTLTVTSAGHPPALLMRQGGQPQFLVGGGDVLGAFNAVSFHTGEYQVGSGDRLVLYSDGLLGAAREAHPLCERVAALNDVSLSAMVAALGESYLVEHDLQRDDQVVLAIEV